MLALRPYKPCDSEKIASWLQDEEIFLKWSGGRFGSFPPSAEDFDRKYCKENGSCSEEDNFYPLTAVDEKGSALGSFIIRYTNGDPRQLRFGWVVVDSSARGKGTGSTMLTLGLKYAFEILGAQIVTIGVYENNAPARACYKKLGFSEVKTVAAEPWNLVEMEISAENYGKSPVI